MARWQVFIVDDDPMFTRMTRTVLEVDGRYDVVGTAASVGLALSGLDGVDPDVLLLDHQLPDALGAHAAQTLRTVAPRARVVVLSASPAAEDFVELGVDHWVDKADALVLPDLLAEFLGESVEPA